MRWLDCAGAPGSGKSTLCYKYWGDKSVTSDGLPPPPEWKPFIDEMAMLMRLVSDHPSIQAVLRMNDRSLKKMSAVHRMVPPPDKPVFIQTGFVQRILGFGWRLQDMNRDINLIRRALWLMPASAGCVFLDASLETLLQRNRDREQVAATAHENRSAQVPLMLPSIAIAKEVLRERGVPVLELDVENQSVEAARAKLIDFANACTHHTAPDGSGGEVALLQASA